MSLQIRVAAMSLQILARSLCWVLLDAHIANVKYIAPIQISIYSFFYQPIQIEYLMNVVTLKKRRGRNVVLDVSVTHSISHVIYGKTHNSVTHFIRHPINLRQPIQIIVHSDLKPQNYMLVKKRLKLAIVVKGEG